VYMLLDGMLGSKVAVKTLRTMLKQPYREWFLTELVSEVGVGVGPLMKALKEFVARGVAQERIVGKQHFYKPNLENQVTRSLFDLFTMERTLEIPTKLRTALQEFVAKLRTESKEDLLSVVLFGSAATGRATPESDLDLLLIFSASPKDDKKIRMQLDSVSGFYDTLLQEHIMTKNEFLEMYGYGDDLVANALANGIVFYDTGFLAPLLSKPLPIPSTRVATQNLEEARRKIEDAKRNYRAGSLDTTIELLGLAASFAARAYLILKGELPGSRHDLVSQMRKYSAQFAALLDNVTKARTRAAHAKTSIGKEAVWNMLTDCERFVREGYEESGSGS
jgi:predicted nucleotidyltransferase/HEPN domain-containing protein